MPPITSRIEEIKGALIQAAISNGVVYWRTIFAICEPERAAVEDEDGDFVGCVFRTLDAASMEICPHQTAVYSALVEKPKESFFDMYTIKNRPYYQRIAQGVLPQVLAEYGEHWKKAKDIVREERKRVYADAARFSGTQQL